MKLGKALVVGAFVALLLPATGSAQRGPRGMHGQRQAGTPMERLLEHRDELGLSDEQVLEMERLRDELRAENAPYRERIEAVREELGLALDRSGSGPPSDEERAKLHDFRQRTRDDMRAMMDNSRAGMDAARELLTDDQRESARDLMRAGARHQGRRGMRGSRGAGHEGKGEMHRERRRT
ncbi:MAG: Spy/CpxP family protein refolding chaperone [Gemmatimonadota bacterium]